MHVSDVRFSNHYSHRVMVLQQTTHASRVPAVGGGSEWKVAVPWKFLMPSPHCEEGAEDAFSLEEELGESGLEEVTRLRLYVQQPSALWRQFNLHNIQVLLFSACAFLQCRKTLARIHTHTSKHTKKHSYVHRYSDGRTTRGKINQ